MPLDHDSNHGGLDGQLALLYAERERLQNELGTADAEELINMFRSFENQLNSLYQDRSSGSETASGDATNPVEEIRSLSNALSDIGRPEIVYEAEQGRRTIRAVWRAA